MESLGIVLNVIGQISHPCSIRCNDIRAKETILQAWAFKAIVLPGLEVKQSLHIPGEALRVPGG